jgi:large subunit ribosomal protein L18
MPRLNRKPKNRAEQRLRRHLRLRKKVTGTAERPRLVVYRSLKHIYAQLVDDARGVVLLGVADRSDGVAKTDGGKIAKGFAVGMALAERAKSQGITRVVFDRAGYAYHGRVKAVADGARKGGLEF